MAVGHEIVPQRGVDVASRRGLVPGAPQALHGPDDLRVVPQPRTEGEISAVGGGFGDLAGGAVAERAILPDRLAEVDGAAPSLPDRLQHRAHRLHGIVRQPERAGEDVGAATGDHDQRGPCPVAVQHAVDGLVDGAVAAEDGDHVEALLARAAREHGGVPSVPGLLHRQVDGRTQSAYEDIPRTTVGRRRHGIDQEECAHVAQRIHRSSTCDLGQVG